MGNNIAYLRDNNGLLFKVQVVGEKFGTSIPTCTHWNLLFNFNFNFNFNFIHSLSIYNYTIASTRV